MTEIHLTGVFFKIPQEISPSRRTIIRSYLRLREIAHENIVREIAQELGYTLDKNNSNEFVRRVIREFLETL